MVYHMAFLALSCDFFTDVGLVQAVVLTFTGPFDSVFEVALQLDLRTLVGTMLKRRVHCIARDLAHLSLE